MALLQKAVSQLLRASQHGRISENKLAEFFDKMRLAVDAMPLASGVYSTAVNRLASVEHYLRTGEPGAAKWELEQLLRGLASC
jgi:hypothetical protein